jgi:hypothetical protein
VRDPPLDGPRCAGTGLRGLSVGPLALKGLPAGLITVKASPLFGEISYAAALPAGSVQPGTVQVEAPGGAEIGPFQTGLRIPRPVEITTSLLPGTLISDRQPFRVTWTGGDPDAVVSMQLISQNPGQEFGLGCECRALASDGQVTMGLVSIGGGVYRLPVLARDIARVIITVTPRQATTFSAPGLTREATHAWAYEYRFTGLQIRTQ